MESETHRYVVKRNTLKSDNKLPMHKSPQRFRMNPILLSDEVIFIEHCC